MRVWMRWCFALLLIVLAVWLQTSVIPVLRVPGSYVPLSAVIFVIAARNFTSAFAIGLGLAGGFIMDTAPPASGPVGLMMLTCAVVGLVVSGWVFGKRADAAGVFGTWVAVIAFVGVLTVVRISVGAVAATGMTLSATPWALFHDALLAALLGPILIPAIDFCLRPRGNEQTSSYLSWSR